MAYKNNPPPGRAATEASNSTRLTIEYPEEPAFIETGAHTRFAEFADACTKYRYIGVCHGRPGVGKTRSARQYAAWPDMQGYAAASKLSEPLAEAILKCQAIFYTATVSNTPKTLDSSLGISMVKLGYARLTLAGSLSSAGGFESAQKACPLIIVDEADRLTIKSLEHLRDLSDRYRFGLVLLGMPGIERRLARYAQFYSRIGFVHEFKPLTETEMRFVLAKHADTFGLSFDLDRLEGVEALAAVIRITRGNFRLMERLFAQMKRIMMLNRVEDVSGEVVDAARDCLVIGPGD